jgi:engulfment/cell motility protein 1
MEHGIMQWEVVGPPFIARMANLITNQATPQEIRTLQAALAILENVVLNSSKYNLVEKELTLPNLAMHLQNASRPIQQNTLALINALFLKADDSKRVAIAGTLNVRQIRNSIVMNIIQSKF